MTMPADDLLLKRAVVNARSRRYKLGYPHPRWVAVMDLFGLGSTKSQELIVRMGFDPDEMVTR